MRFAGFLILFAVSVFAHPLKFIDTSIENASPVWYEVDPDGVVRVHLNYDHERDSPNRAAGHIHFKLHAEPGGKLTLEFVNLENVWNSTPGSVARELKAMVVSTNGRDWKSLATEALSTNRIRLHVEMPGPALHVARVEPYRLSDLERFLTSLEGKRNVEIKKIGRTVQGRELEIVRIGNPAAPYRVFLRARAHPWEPVGNWLIEGLTERLLSDEGARFLERYCVYMMPMANKDGVALGRTRFNLLGKDLNRNWNEPSDAQLAPENFALEEWLKGMIANGEKPHLALELHNDGSGRLHISRPPVANLQRSLDRMKIFEELLRKHTFFTEGSTTAEFRNNGTLGEGWLGRFGIDAAVHEFNCNWIAKLKDYPSAAHWKKYGADLAFVFDEYFARTRPKE